MVFGGVKIEEEGTRGHYTIAPCTVITLPYCRTPLAKPFFKRLSCVGSPRRSQTLSSQPWPGEKPQPESRLLPQESRNPTALRQASFVLSEQQLAQKQQTTPHRRFPPHRPKSYDDRHLVTIPATPSRSSIHLPHKQQGLQEDRGSRRQQYPGRRGLSARAPALMAMRVANRLTASTSSTYTSHESMLQRALGARGSLR